MKHIAIALLVFLHITVFAQDFTTYKQHIATDRILVMFNKDVPVDRREALIQATGLVTSFTHVPRPALTICMTNDVDAAMKKFAASNDVRFVSFFITAGKHHAGVLDDFFVKLRSKDFEPLFFEKAKRDGLTEIVADEYIPNLYKVRITGNALTNTAEVCEGFSKEGWCVYATPNYLFNPLVNSMDQFYNRQWNIANTGSGIQGGGTPDADMDVDTAWYWTEGDPNIKVSIVDSGVDTLHADLVDNMLPGHDAIGDSTDGFPTPVYPEDGHGTCCAGIVAASSNNNKGIAGVAPYCRIIPVRGFYYIKNATSTTALPFSTAAFFADAISWSWSVGKADIMSNSWGLPDILLAVLAGGVQPVEDAMQQAYTNGRNGKGTAMFFSSGNEEDSTGAIWPARLPIAIAVTATTMCDERKNPNDCSDEDWGANYGAGTDFGAPGVKITSTDITGPDGFSAGDYNFTFNGTSAACPNAAGVGALVLSVRNTLSAEGVRMVLALTADKVGGYNYDSNGEYGSWCKQLGYGRVNAFNAVTYAYYNTSIGETIEETQIAMFPNPTRGVLNINTMNAEKGGVKIFNVNGILVYEGTIGQGLNRIDISILPEGIYLCQVNTAHGNATTKVSVLK